MANSVDPNQTAPVEQSDLGLQSLLKPMCPICPNTESFIAMLYYSGMKT